jgi:DNA-directed RNA polymerase subunit beta'
VLVPGTDEVLVAAGELIDERRADLIDQAGRCGRCASAAR